MQVAKDSFALFLLPFHFERDDFALLQDRQQEAAKSGDWTRVTTPHTDLLAASLLQDLCRGGSEDALVSWKMGNVALHAWCGYGADWELRCKEDFALPFDFRSVELHVTRTGFGFLVVEAVPRSSEYAAWLDFLHYFRFADGARGVSVCGNRDISRATSGKATPFDFDGPFENHVAPVLNALLDRAGWWKPTFAGYRLVPFYHIAVDDSDDAEAMWTLYQLRNFFRSDSTLHPSASDLDPDHVGLRPYAEGQWFVFSLEGGGFHARNRPAHEFFRTTLPTHIRTEYLTIFLLALHQRFHLQQLAHDLAAAWNPSSPALTRSTLNALLDADLWRSTNYQFSQVAYSDHYQNFYAKWQSVFRTPALADEVKQKMVAMNGYLQSFENRRIENKLAAYGALVGLPALASSILALNIAGTTPAAGWNLTQVVSVLICSAVAGLGIFFLWLRR